MVKWCLWFHFTIVDKFTMGKWYTMISFHHSRLLHTAIWQVFILWRHKKESIFHHGNFINAAIREWKDQLSIEHQKSFTRLLKRENSSVHKTFFMLTGRHEYWWIEFLWKRRNWWIEFLCEKDSNSVTKKTGRNKIKRHQSNSHCTYAYAVIEKLELSYVYSCI